jgi:hypothetical protein
MGQNLKMFIPKCRNIIREVFSFPLCTAFFKHSILKETAVLHQCIQVGALTITLVISGRMKEMTNTDTESIRPCLSALRVVKTGRED